MKHFEELHNDSIASSLMIQEMDLKNRRKYPRFPTMIIEDFFKEPNAWRTLGLSQEFYSPDREVCPGKRTKHLSEIDRDLFDEFAYRLSYFLPNVQGFADLGVRFHLIDETYVKGWIHDDDPRTDVTGIIYLNHDPVLNSGTTIYDDQIDEYAGKYKNVMYSDMLDSTPEERQENSKYRDGHRNSFTPSIEIDSVFNRCLMFDPKTWHSADNFFGYGNDARLTLVFYARFA